MIHRGYEVHYDIERRAYKFTCLDCGFISFMGEGIYEAYRFTDTNGPCEYCIKKAIEETKKLSRPPIEGIEYVGMWMK